MARALHRLLPLALVLVASCKKKDDDTAPEDTWTPEELGRCAAFDPLRVPLFGDTHVHTRFSLDANLQGNRLAPSEAYAFAKGQQVSIQPHDAQGNPLRTYQLDRPLDWLALSDHAEYLGLVSVCTTPGLVGYEDEICQDYRDKPDQVFLEYLAAAAMEPDQVAPPPLCRIDGVDCDAAEKTAWTEIIEAAEAAYDRTEACGFTSLIGYEWTSSPLTYNLHRNVIFRNERVPELPISYLDQPHAEDLWAALKRECIEAGTGCDALAIPHNSNISDGRMWSGLDRDGLPIDADYARQSAELEPLVEVFQHKGDSECWSATPAGDELCDFEFLPFHNLTTLFLNVEALPQHRDFVRDALGTGLKHQQTLGANPWKYGFIASTDTHLATPGLVSETDYPGHGGAGAANTTLPPGLTDNVYNNPGGLAVVWAEENSREAVFQALRRKEAYGTSGPRITLRFFGGWELPADMCSTGSFAQQGYDGGVPMGGDLGAGSGAPSFALSALRDPQDGLLQRTQIIKGWLEAGEPRYAVYEVGGDPNNGAGIDPATCAVSGPGADDLCDVWTDPDFDPAVPAFWYARVVQNPSCRWHQHMCAQAAVDCADPDAIPEGFDGCCEGLDPAVQERAWSSPIWYTPGG